MNRRWTRIRDDERGTGDVAALMFIVPLAFGVVLLFVYFGRQAASAEGVAHAAHVAAIAASQQRSSGDARLAARDAATATLAAAGTACAGGPVVDVEADVWRPGGVITVTVTCQVDAGDLHAINAPTRLMSGSSRAVIDRYRGYRP